MQNADASCLSDRGLALYVEDLGALLASPRLSCVPHIVYSVCALCLCLCLSFVHVVRSSALIAEYPLVCSPWGEVCPTPSELGNCSSSVGGFVLGS